MARRCALLLLLTGLLLAPVLADAGQAPPALPVLQLESVHPELSRATHSHRIVDEDELPSEAQSSDRNASEAAPMPPTPPTSPTPETPAAETTAAEPASVSRAPTPALSASPTPAASTSAPAPTIAAGAVRAAAAPSPSVSSAPQNRVPASSATSDVSWSTAATPAPSSASSTTSKKEHEEEKRTALSKSAIAGVVLGCLALTAAAVVSVLVYRRSVARLREEAMFADLLSRDAASKRGVRESDAAYAEM